MNTTVTMTLDELRKRPLTEEELATIRNARSTPTDDCPAQTKEELAQFRPWYEVHPNESNEREAKVKDTSAPVALAVHAHK